ncbi:Manganese/iron superoxide dismutase [Podospora conica]|nr:Manganese/iron superoxide dismutase [Schizothecium conicum]
MFRPRLRIPRAPRFAGLARPCTSPSPFLSMAASSPSLLQSRSKHTVPELNLQFPNEQAQANWLFSGIGYNIAWRNAQKYFLGKLDTLTAGTELESEDLKTVLLKTARDPEFAHIFNYASAAHNNHFFFKHIATEPVAMPRLLVEKLEGSFGSIETLRREMVNTAAAMFGPGFVWLVRTTNPVGGGPAFKVLATYLAGSPYPGAHWRRQANDLNTAVGPTEAGLETAKQYLEDTAYGQGKQVSAAAQHRKAIAPGGIDLIPVLCLNVWEHAYLADHGVGGKLQFAERWWNFIDWEKVYKEATPEIS